VIRKAHLLFCDNEHGTGDVVFPDLTRLAGFEIQQAFIEGNNVRSVRKAAKAQGWGRVNGGDYCPDCMESMKEDSR
jgi:hypothetical protein